MANTSNNQGKFHLVVLQPAGPGKAYAYSVSNIPGNSLSQESALANADFIYMQVNEANGNLYKRIGTSEPTILQIPITATVPDEKALKREARLMRSRAAAKIRRERIKNDPVLRKLQQERQHRQYLKKKEKKRNASANESVFTTQRTEQPCPVAAPLKVNLAVKLQATTTTYIKECGNAQLGYVTFNDPQEVTEDSEMVDKTKIPIEEVPQDSKIVDETPVEREPNSNRKHHRSVSAYDESQFITIVNEYDLQEDDILNFLDG